MLEAWWVGGEVEVDATECMMREFPWTSDSCDKPESESLSSPEEGPSVRSVPLLAWSQPNLNQVFSDKQVCSQRVSLSSNDVMVVSG